MERLHVMEYTPSQRKNGLRNTVYRWTGMIARLATLMTGSLLFAATAANGAIIKINPDDSPDNVIQLDGDLTATVVHTAEGMTIDIPGVKISLDCGTGDSCTIAVGSGSNDSGSNDSVSNDSGSNDSGNATSSQEEYCANNPNGHGCYNDSGSGSSSSNDDAGSSDDSGSEDPCANVTGYNPDCASTSGDSSSSSGTDDDDSSEDSGSDDPCANVTGYNPDCASTDDGETGDPDDPCANVIGYNPDCGSTSSGDDDPIATAFPNGDSRKIDDVSGFGSRDFDFGSGGNKTQNAYELVIPQGTVKVTGFTMMSATYQEKLKEDGTSYEPKQYTSQRIDPTTGSISYAPIGSSSGVAARVWISKTPDGDRLSSACSWNTGYVEGAFDVSVDGSKQCDLEVGGSYYMNVAVCSSARSDYRCSDPSARSADKDLKMIWQAVYRR